MCLGYRFVVGIAFIIEAFGHIITIGEHTFFIKAFREISEHSFHGCLF